MTAHDSGVDLMAERVKHMIGAPNVVEHDKAVFMLRKKLFRLRNFL